MTKKSIIACGLLLLLALLFALSAIGQQPMTNQTPPTAASYIWTPVISDGTVIGNRHFDNKTTRYAPGPYAFSDDGSAAVIAAQFPDPQHVGITGLYLSNPPSVVVEQFDVIDGNTIEAIINSRNSDVQIDAAKEVAWRARFSGKSCASGNCAGLFLREPSGLRKLIAIEASGTGTYFLSQEGKIAGPAGAWTAPPVITTNSNASGGDSKKKGIFRTLGGYVSGTVWLPIPVGKRGGGSVAVSTTANSTNTNQQQAVLREGQTSKTAFAADGAFKLETMPPAPNCAVPAAFPWPWDDLGNASGPIGFSRTDPGGIAAARYVPVGRPPAAGAWGRSTYYTRNCIEIAVALWDGSGKGTTEIDTPIGLVTFLDQKLGVYKFAGLDDVAPPASGRIDTEMSISHRCEILIPIAFAKLGAGKAVLKGSPANKANCPQQ